MVPETAAERPSGGVHRERRGPQAGVAPCLSNAASKVLIAGGDRVICLEPNKKETAKGEVSGSLPGSKSVARAEDETRNLGDPADARRSNRGNQVGRQAQRQEESAESKPGVRSLHSNPEIGLRLSTGRRERHLNAVRIGNQCRKNDGTKLANLPAGHSHVEASARAS